MTITIVDRIDALRQAVDARRQAGARIGFVPTMGALHAGHARLIDVARSACDCVVVSIFVNPLQFDRRDDLERYPRDLAADTAVCAAHGAEIVFAPSVEEMYPQPMACSISVGRIADHLCGGHRPGHFAGVANVVMKLLLIAAADAAYFGEKDAQQLAVVRRMVSDFNVPVRIVGVPTVRESDGLALSSRNQRLSEAERQRAPLLHAALREMRSQIAGGATYAEEIKQRGAALIPSSAGLELEYLELVEPEEFQPVAEVTGAVIAAGALWVGNTRLIDNLLCTPGRHS
jgi:pantoate--beta-alanine ligase